jgi:hypothetical protein
MPHCCKNSAQAQLSLPDHVKAEFSSGVIGELNTLFAFRFQGGLTIPRMSPDLYNPAVDRILHY